MNYSEYSIYSEAGEQREQQALLFSSFSSKHILLLSAIFLFLQGFSKANQFLETYTREKSQFQKAIRATVAKKIRIHALHAVKFHMLKTDE